jgi:hypothetical protein
MSKEIVAVKVDKFRKIKWEVSIFKDFVLYYNCMCIRVFALFSFYVYLALLVLVVAVLASRISDAGSGDSGKSSKGSAI